MTGVLDRRKYLTTEEAERLLIYARGRSGYKAERDYILLASALNGGLRCGEVARLNLSDFRLDREGHALFDIWNSKRTKSREVYLQPEAGDLIRQWIAKERRKTTYDSPVFSYRRKDGSYSRLTSRRIQLIFKQIAKACGLPQWFRFHCLRHTYATLYYRATKDILALKEQLGHENIQTTQIYSRVTPEAHRHNLGLLANGMPLLPSKRRLRRSTL